MIMRLRDPESRVVDKLLGKARGKFVARKPIGVNIDGVDFKAYVVSLQFANIPSGRELELSLIVVPPKQSGSKKKRI